MVLYWSLFVVPAFMALWEDIRYSKRLLHPAILLIIGLFVVMAFRESGGDYYTYNLMIERFRNEPLLGWLGITDPLYGLLNWLSIKVGAGLYGVNGACALIFLLCLYKFALDEPKPFLLLAAAIPYLVIVVAIGYTRQGTAIGIFMLGLTFVRRRKLLPYLLCCLAAIGFHSSAILTLPFAYFCISSDNKYKNFTMYLAILISILAGIYMFQSKFQTFYVHYLESDRYSSSGAFQRSLLNGLAGGVLLLYRRRWIHYFSDYKTFLVLALLAIVSVPLSLFQSTAVDRIGLFLLPLQVLVFSRLPLLQGNPRWRHITTIGIVVAYALVLYVWLHLGAYSSALWLPYKSLFFGDIS